MSTWIIRAEQLAKKYELGAAGTGSYDTLRDKLSQVIGHPLRVLARKQAAPPKPSRELWALRDASFEINTGEVVGIVGRNGAGKSTLLKVLARITAPSRGRAEVRGRIASLLEVGTGFHPELTGRENVYLNGALLGMTRAEIRARFDEIVDFSGVERFLDMPVKRYSSGMAVRLAFSVAAHLEAEVLIVDEVLAVGDAAFQKKCMGRMGDVVRGGRTVLLVSHNLAVINSLCSRCMYMVEGRVEFVGTASEAVSAYISTGAQQGERTWSPSAHPSAKMALLSLRVRNAEGAVSNNLDLTFGFDIEVEYEIFEPIRNMRVVVTVVTSDGTVLLAVADAGDAIDWRGRDRTPGRYTSRCRFPARLLNGGAYALTVGADVPFGELLCREEAALTFSVEQNEAANGDRWPGIICPDLLWTEERAS